MRTKRKEKGKERKAVSGMFESGKEVLMVERVKVGVSEIAVRRKRED
jgi:hypothetical protein